MIHAVAPLLLVAVLFGTGIYGVLARRNAILLLIGIELMLAAAGLLFVTVEATMSHSGRGTGQAMTIFVITIAAAETVVALGLVMAIFRARGRVDLAPEDDS